MGTDNRQTLLEFGATAAARIQERGTQDSSAIQAHLLDIAEALAAGISLEEMRAEQGEEASIRDAFLREARIGAAGVRLGIDYDSRTWRMLELTFKLSAWLSETVISSDEFVQCQIRDAMAYLNKLRAGIGTWVEHSPLDRATKSGITLERLDTTEAEVKRLERGAKARLAKVALARVRNGYGDLVTFRRWIRAALDVGVTVEELGTSDEEIAQLGT